MLPFFIQSTIQNTQYKYKERQRAWIEQSIEEASYDAGLHSKRTQHMPMIVNRHIIFKYPSRSYTEFFLIV